MMTVGTLPTPEQFKQHIADRTWVEVMELENKLVRLPQPESRQPNRKSWIDAALVRLDTIELVSDRTVLLTPTCGNRVICRYDRDTFIYVPDGAGGTVWLSLPELDDITIRVRCKGRPHRRLRLNGRPARTTFQAVIVWGVDNTDPDNLHTIMDRASETI